MKISTRLFVHLIALAILLAADVFVFAQGKELSGDAVAAVRATLANLTPSGDVWGATNYGIPPFGTPSRYGRPGFRYDPQNKWFALTGDADGNGFDDIIQVTSFGDVWVSTNTAVSLEPSRRWGWLGFMYDEKEGSRGWYPLAGDANGDGMADMIEVTEYGDAWVALASETEYFDPPSRWGWLGYEFSRGGVDDPGAIPLVGDANGDHKCDLIQVTRYGDAWVAISTETSYGDPTRWGWLGFQYNPVEGCLPLCGDFNADGKDDLAQVTSYGDVWVALSTETSYADPTRWGWLGFTYNEFTGDYPIAADVNSVGKTDLIEITKWGDAWVSLSKGDAFDTPEKWGSPKFIFSRENKYLPFYLNY